MAEAFASQPYPERLKHVSRPEECDEADLLAAGLASDVNDHLGTAARELPELVEQLGVLPALAIGQRWPIHSVAAARYPSRRRRLGCDVYASDLNPIACMLTWGAFNIMGPSKERRAEIEEAQRDVAKAVDAEITRLGIEHDARATVQSLSILPGNT